MAAETRHSTAAGGIDVTIPATAEVAPPGYYMLFLVTAHRVPSVGQFVRIN